MANEEKITFTMFKVMGDVKYFNVLHIPEGGDYEALNYQLTMNINRSTKLHISTTTPLLGICCYSQCFFQRNY